MRMALREIRIKERISYKHENSGKFCFVTDNKELLDQVTTREGVVLKIFFEPIKKGTIRSYVWGRHFNIEVPDAIGEPTTRRESSRLTDASIIQSVCATKDLAPRIYELGCLRIGYQIFPFQLVEDVSEMDFMSLEERERVYKEIQLLGLEKGFTCRFPDIGMADNVRGGMLIDFQGFTLSPGYSFRSIERYYENTKFAGNVYQQVGWQDSYRSDKRSRLIQNYTDSGKLSFTGKKVLDIGCNGGEFCRLSHDNGASRITGVDLKEVVESAKEVSDLHYYFNIDWRGKTLSMDEDISLEYVPDIIFFLSMKRHIGLPPMLFKSKVAIYEHNGDEPPEATLLKFIKNGYMVDDLGVTGENDNRHTYVFSKK